MGWVDAVPSEDDTAAQLSDNKSAASGLVAIPSDVRFSHNSNEAKARDPAQPSLHTHAGPAASSPGGPSFSSLTDQEEPDTIDVSSGDELESVAATTRSPASFTAISGIQDKATTVKLPWLHLQRGRLSIRSAMMLQRSIGTSTIRSSHLRQRRITRLAGLEIPSEATDWRSWLPKLQ